MSLGPTGAACLLGLVGPGGACLGLASRPPQVLIRDRYGACLGKPVWFSVSTFYFMAEEAALAETPGNRGGACSGGGSTGARPAWDPTL